MHPQKGVHVKHAHTEGRGALVYTPDGRHARAIAARTSPKHTPARDTQEEGESVGL
jgi:hypothetical protein